MSREVEIEDVEVADLKIFQEVCEANKLRWQVMEDGSIRVYDENPGGPTYRRSFDLVQREGSQTYKIITDNDARYSSITARFGPDCGTLIRDYGAARLTKRYRTMGGMVKQTVRSDQWVELRVSIGGVR